MRTSKVTARVWDLPNASACFGDNTSFRFYRGAKTNTHGRKQPAGAGFLAGRSHSQTLPFPFKSKDFYTFQRITPNLSKAPKHFQLDL